MIATTGSLSPSGGGGADENTPVGVGGFSLTLRSSRDRERCVEVGGDPSGLWKTSAGCFGGSGGGALDQRCAVGADGASVPNNAF
ncbi:MAG: hypothetical protein R3A47_01190 [Polyangiales bacterium]